MSQPNKTQVAFLGLGNKAKEATTTRRRRSRHRSFRLTWPTEERLKPHLATAMVSVVAFSLLCGVLAIVGVCFASLALPRWLSIPLFYLAPGVSFYVGQWMLIRLFATLGVLTANEARDYPVWSWKGRKEYPESWLESPDDNDDRA